MQRAVSEGMWGLHEEMVHRFQSMEGQIVELRQLQRILAQSFLIQLQPDNTLHTDSSLGGDSYLIGIYASLIFFCFGVITYLYV